MKTFTLKTFSRAIRVIFQSILLSVFLTISACGGGGSTTDNGGGLPPAPQPPAPPTAFPPVPPYSPLPTPTPAPTTPPPLPPTASGASDNLITNLNMATTSTTSLYVTYNIPAPNPSNGLNYRTDEFNENYGLSVIKADVAYQRGYFGQGVTVAVVDTGLRTSHNEFRGVAVGGRDFTSYERVSDGTNFIIGTDVTDNSGGGTRIAGIIAGRADKDGSPYGVAPLAKIMPLKSYGGRDLEAWGYAISNNVKIINNTSGWGVDNIYGRFNGKGLFYRIEVPYIRAINNGGILNYARDYADAVRDKDVVVVLAAQNRGWQPETGMIDAERLYCKDREYCGNGYEVFSYNTITANFISEDYIRSYTYEDGTTMSHTISAVGDFATLDISSGTDFFPGAPFWAVEDIDKFLRDSSSTHELISMVSEDSNFRAFGLRWLSVVSTDEDNIISSFSNGCGIAEYWCLAAPGERIVTADSYSDGEYTTYGRSGTQYAAAHVSGALALLKGRLPSMPMQIIVAILLDTATDLGEPGVDRVYGHGLVNVAAAITSQGMIKVARTTGFSATPSSFNARTSRIVLPAAMAGVKEQLGDAQVAFELPGGLYYNTPLSEFVDIQDAPKKSLGNAAAALLREEEVGQVQQVQSGMFFAGADSAGQLRYAGADVDGGAFGEWQVRRDFCDDCGNNAVWQEWQDAGDDVSAPASPFFAGGGQDRFLLQMRGEGFNGVQPFAAFGKSSPDGDSAYQQFGLRWSGSVGEGFSLLAEASRIDEDEHFMGADWRAFGAEESRTWQGRFALRGEIAAGWKSFLQFTAARGDVDVKDGGFLRGASGLRADGFLAGLERSDVLFGGDKLRLWAGQETALRGGKLHLRYPQATGDFAAAFSGISGQTLQTSETDVELSAVNSSVLALGYAMRLSDDSAAAFAIEKRGDESAVSGQFRFRF